MNENEEKIVSKVEDGVITNMVGDGAYTAVPVTMTLSEMSAKNRDYWERGRLPVSETYYVNNVPGDNPLK